MPLSAKGKARRGAKVRAPIAAAFVSSRRQAWVVHVLEIPPGRGLRPLPTVASPEAVFPMQGP